MFSCLCFKERQPLNILEDADVVYCSASKSLGKTIPVEGAIVALVSCAGNIGDSVEMASIPSADFEQAFWDMVSPTPMVTEEPEEKAVVMA